MREHSAHSRLIVLKEGEKVLDLMLQFLHMMPHWSPTAVSIEPGRAALQICVVLYSLLADA